MDYIAVYNGVVKREREGFVYNGPVAEIEQEKRVEPARSNDNSSSHGAELLRAVRQLLGRAGCFESSWTKLCGSPGMGGDRTYGGGGGGLGLHGRRVRE